MLCDHQRRNIYYSRLLDTDGLYLHRFLNSVAVLTSGNTMGDSIMKQDTSICCQKFRLIKSIETHCFLQIRRWNSQKRQYQVRCDDMLGSPFCTKASALQLRFEILLCTIRSGLTLHICRQLSAKQSQRSGTMCEHQYHSSQRCIRWW